MNKWIKIILIITGLGIMSGIVGYIFVYNKSHPDFAKLQPEFTITAPLLFTEFKNDAALAQQTYNGKMVLISGIPAKTEISDTMGIVVFVFDQGMFGDEGIRCTFLPEELKKVADLKPGTEIAIKGYLTGYNEVDIILEKCSFHNYSN